MTSDARHLLFDGLIVARWGSDIFRAMRKGDISGVNATCAVWEGPSETLDNLGQWWKWFRDFPDLIVPAASVRAIADAYQRGVTAVVLGFQNASPIGDRLERVALFKQLGVGIIQLTYNTQNSGRVRLL